MGVRHTVTLPAREHAGRPRKFMWECHGVSRCATPRTADGVRPDVRSSCIMVCHTLCCVAPRRTADGVRPDVRALEHARARVVARLAHLRAPVAPRDS